MTMSCEYDCWCTCCGSEVHCWEISLHLCEDELGKKHTAATNIFLCCEVDSRGGHTELNTEDVKMSGEKVRGGKHIQPDTLMKLMTNDDVKADETFRCPFC